MIFRSPLSVILPRKTKKDKKVLLNLNTYRNLHYRINNDAKIQYLNDMESQLKNIILNDPISVTFKLYKKSKRLVDKNNIYSIIAKFFYDALVHYGCIPDDNDDFIKWEIYHPTQYNAADDYCDIEIQESK